MATSFYRTPLAHHYQDLAARCWRGVPGGGWGHLVTPEYSARMLAAEGIGHALATIADQAALAAERDQAAEKVRRLAAQLGRPAGCESALAEIESATAAAFAGAPPASLFPTDDRIAAAVRSCLPGRNEGARLRWLADALDDSLRAYSKSVNYCWIATRVRRRMEQRYGPDFAAAEAELVAAAATEPADNLR
jgi:hypothetical protein